MSEVMFFTDISLCFYFLKTQQDVTYKRKLNQKLQMS